MIPLGIKWSGTVFIRSCIGLGALSPVALFSAMGSDKSWLIIASCSRPRRLKTLLKHEQPSHRKLVPPGPWLKVPDRFAICYGESQVVPLG